jgi:DNA gyrase/topoisomerase IV subunit B
MRSAPPTPTRPPNHHTHSSRPPPAQTNAPRMHQDSIEVKDKLALARKIRKSKQTNMLKVMPKLEDANEAGGRHSDNCTLILTEGDSAKVCVWMCGCVDVWVCVPSHTLAHFLCAAACPHTLHPSPSPSSPCPRHTYPTHTLTHSPRHPPCPPSYCPHGVMSGAPTIHHPPTRPPPGTPHHGPPWLDAQALAVSGLSVLGRDLFGVFPLRGKLLNVRELDAKDAIENAEVSAIVAILGLDFNKTWVTISCVLFRFRGGNGGTGGKRSRGGERSC